MNPADLKPTSTTPAIVFENNDKIIIKGRSIPLSDARFYDPFIAWAEKVESSRFTVEINLEYMNSSSSKKLLLFLKTLEGNAKIDKLKVIWYYEEGDEENLEHGRLFERLLKKTEFRFMKFRDTV